MGVGGATWDTAGTLEAGGGNAFLIADTTESADVFDNVAWWTFTPTANVVGRFTVLPAITDNVGFRLYSGANEASKVLVPRTFEDFTQVSTLSPGVTYHLLVGTFDTVEEPSYQVTYAPTQLTVSPWISTLRDRDDNQLVISSGELVEENTSEFQFQHAWYGQVVDAIRPPGRASSYGVLEDFGGPPISGALACIWSHALWGDNGGTGTWDGVCPPLVTGVADDALNSSVSYSVEAEDTDNPFADSGSANIAMSSRALYFLPVRDNIDQRGVFSFPDPELEGYPADAEIEWETPTIELVKVEITGDLPVRPAEGTLLEGIAVSLRDVVRPTGGGNAWDEWSKGMPGTWDLTGDQHIQFTYIDGDPVWTEITGIVSGDDGWDGLVDYTTDADADEVAIVGMEAAFGGGPEVESGDSASSEADIALRFTLRSPRYRWIYEGATAPGGIPPRRILARSW